MTLFFLKSHMHHRNELIFQLSIFSDQISLTSIIALHRHMTTHTPRTPRLPIARPRPRNPILDRPKHVSNKDYHSYPPFFEYFAFAVEIFGAFLKSQYCAEWQIKNIST